MVRDEAMLPTNDYVFKRIFGKPGNEEITKFHTKWEIREEEYGKIILTDVLEIHIIELPKLIIQLNNNNISKKDKTVLWSLFIANPKGVGEKEMSENEDIKKANDEFEKINEDEHEKYLAHLRLKHIMDTKAVERYGYKKGKEAGIAEKQKEIILKLNNKNFSIEEISEIIDLNEEEIKTIIKESN